MPFYMMHADKRKPRRISNRLCFCHSDKQRPYKSRAVRNRDRINIFQCYLRLFQRFFNHLIDFFNMFPRCNFRNNSAI